MVSVPGNIWHAAICQPNANGSVSSHLHACCSCLCRVEAEVQHMSVQKLQEVLGNPRLVSNEPVVNGTKCTKEPQQAHVAMGYRLQHVEGSCPADAVTSVDILRPCPLLE
eukprot:GHRR01033028.1.p3 GENE.GHRR01033028.1~~GHRR01033028.1.p3  ORF type:complete len:110 (+),score=22.23 GHRR01033028.1:2053-2382(+)